MLGIQSLDSWDRRLLQPKSSKAWKQLHDPVPGQVAVGRKVVLHGEIHGGSRTEELKNCGMLCQVNVVGRPGHAGEGVVREKSTPLGTGRAVFLLMEWLGVAWRGPGDNKQGWSYSSCLYIKAACAG